MKNLLALLIASYLVGCATQTTQLTPDAALEQKLSDLKPGLGEIMGVIQQHHAKLYFSGSAQNWDLAQYQMEEIKEGIEDAVKYYPKFKEVKLPLTELVPKIMDLPLKNLSQAIHDKNKPQFMKTFTSLTNACNSCHQAAEHGFIMIQAPKGHEFSNQKFTP